jgi:hypothetical protein
MRGIRALLRSTGTDRPAGPHPPGLGDPAAKRDHGTKRQAGWICLFVPLLLLVLLAAGCGTQPTPTPAVECKLYLLAGQSNMVGRGRHDELPPEDQSLPDNVEIHAVALDAGLNDVRASFGPEHSLARDLGQAYPDHRLILVKYAVDASSLLDWAPDWDRATAEATGHPEFGPLYRKLLDLVAEVQRGSQTPCQAAAVFWMQGERDARFPGAGEQYEQNLTHLIGRLRADLGVPGLPFIVGQVNPPLERYPLVEEVRAAQARVVQAAGNAVLVPTEGLPKTPDNLHYNTAGQMELGRRFAEAFLDLAGP